MAPERIYKQWHTGSNECMQPAFRSWFWNTSSHWKQTKEFLEDMADFQSGEKKIKDEFRTSCCTRKEGTAQ